MKYGSPTVQWVSVSVLLLLLTTAVSFSFDWRADAKQAQRAEKISQDLKELARGSSKDERVSVIIQFAGSPGAGLVKLQTFRMIGRTSPFNFSWSRSDVIQAPECFDGREK